MTAALLATRVPLPVPDPLTWHGALTRWRRLPAIAQSLGRTHDFALTQAQEASLKYLGAWHHTLTYADPNAETWLHDRYVSLGEMDGRHTVTRMISANLASAVVAEAAGLFDWAYQVTGLPRPAHPPGTTGRNGERPPVGGRSFARRDRHSDRQRGRRQLRAAGRHERCRPRLAGFDNPDERSRPSHSRIRYRLVG